MANRWYSRVSVFLVLFCFPELLLSAVVTLESIEIYTTHEWTEWISSKPTVYFQCIGENKTVLPDVKKAKTVYTFKGEESFQPLTDFRSKKCKRCGVYEEDRIKSDDIFDEWELCPSDFNSSDGRYVHTKPKQFNATFLCDECVQHGSSENESRNEKSGMHWSKIIIGLSVVISTALFIMGFAVAYRYWQKRRRQSEQVRFLKLFEDNDDIEDELGIGPLSDSI